MPLFRGLRPRWNSEKVAGERRRPATSTEDSVDMETSLVEQYYGDCSPTGPPLRPGESRAASAGHHDSSVAGAVVNESGGSTGREVLVATGLRSRSSSPPAVSIKPREARAL